MTKSLTILVYTHETLQKMKGNTRARGNIRSGQHIIILVKFSYRRHKYRDTQIEVQTPQTPSDNSISYIIN